MLLITESCVYHYLFPPADGGQRLGDLWRPALLARVCSALSPVLLLLVQVLRRTHHSVTFVGKDPSWVKKRTRLESSETAGYECLVCRKRGDDPVSEGCQNGYKVVVLVMSKPIG